MRSGGGVIRLITEFGDKKGSPLARPRNRADNAMLQDGHATGFHDNRL